MQRGFDIIEAFSARFLRAGLGGEAALLEGLAGGADWPEISVERAGL